MTIKTLLNQLIAVLALSVLTISPGYAGGSNILAWQVDQNCSSNYGVIKNYGDPNVQGIVYTALQKMYVNGQRQLRVMVLFADNPMDNTTLSSHNGTLVGQDLTNFQQLIQQIKSDGFYQVQFGFGPVSAYNIPDQWSSWQEANYEQNWNFIAHVVHLVMDPPPNGPGMTDAGFDLWPEAFPTNGNPQCNPAVDCG